MAWWNGNAFCITGPLWGAFTYHQWIPHVKGIQRRQWICRWFRTLHDIAHVASLYWKICITNSSWLSLCHFPGTHWMTTIMKHLLHIEKNTSRDEGFNLMELDLSKKRNVPPFIDVINALPSPRTYSSHLVVDYFRRPLETKKTKFVVVMRNVKDVLVSSYHFYRGCPALGLFKGTFEEFMEMVKVKRIRSWFDWMLGWGVYQDYPNTIFIKYEDMKKDLPSEIRRLAKFLEIEVTEEVVADVCDKTSFNNMSDEINAREITDPKISPFMRKGEVGDWKNYFSDDLNNYVDEMYKDVESLGLHFGFE